MLKPRIIKPDFWLDETIMSCSITARLFFLGLWAVSNGKGIFKWSPLTLRLLIFPGDRDVDTQSLLEELQAAGLIVKFGHDRQPMGLVVHFDEYQNIDRRRREASAYTKDPKIRRAVFDRDGRFCRHCDAIDDLALDHIIPVAAGGEDELENMQVLCRSCNSRKGARIWPLSSSPANA